MKHHVLKHALRALTTLLLVATVRGPLTAQELSSLPERLDQAVDTFQPITASQMETLQATVVADAELLEQQMRGVADEPYWSDWAGYLHWERLDALSAGEPVSTSDLALVHLRLQGGNDLGGWDPIDGLEHPWFMPLRRSLGTYVATRQIFEASNTVDDFSAQIEELKGLLATYEQSFDDQVSYRMGEILGWLELTNAPPELVADVRRKVSYPNLVTSIRAVAMLEKMTADVNLSRPVREQMMGAESVGTVDVEGVATARLEPSDDSIRVVIEMSGTALLNTTSSRGNVTVAMLGNVLFQGEKVVELIGGGKVRNEPADVQTRANVRVRNVWARTALMARLASRAVQRMIPRVNAQVGSTSRQMISKEFDDMAEREASTLLQNQLPSFIDYHLVNPLTRRDAMPRNARFHSTTERVGGKLYLVQPSQLGAPAPPVTPLGVHPIDVAIHQSLVRNLTQTMIGGSYQPDSWFESVILQLKGEVPRELRVHRRTTPWSVVFDETAPITTDFDNERLTLGMRLSRFKVEDREYEVEFAAFAPYAMEFPEDEVFLLRRSAEPEFVVGEVPEGIDSEQFSEDVDFLQRKLTAFLVEETSMEGIFLPDVWKLPGELEIHRAVMQDGWVTLGASMVPPADEATHEDTNAGVE